MLFICGFFFVDVVLRARGRVAGKISQTDGLRGSLRRAPPGEADENSSVGGGSGVTAAMMSGSGASALANGGAGAGWTGAAGSTYSHSRALSRPVSKVRARQAATEAGTSAHGTRHKLRARGDRRWSC